VTAKVGKASERDGDERGETCFYFFFLFAVVVVVVAAAAAVVVVFILFIGP
jgi:hypothetical protein